MDNQDEAFAKLNKYYELKLNHDNQLKNIVTKIGRQDLSLIEKQAMYQDKIQTRLKCVFCKKAGYGTEFTTEIRGSDKILSAKCHPNNKKRCNDEIIIQINDIDDLSNMQYIKQSQTIIQDSQQSIIDYKNKILFGCNTYEQVKDKIETIKDKLANQISIYQQALIVIELTDAHKRLAEITQLDEQIAQYANDMKELPTESDRVEMYAMKMVPLIQKKRDIKYQSFAVSNSFVHKRERCDATFYDDYVEPHVPYLGNAAKGGGLRGVV